MKVLVAATLALCLLVLPGCVHVHHDQHPKYKAGPPPWAPAHGYRHKHHHGPELVFNAHFGVYTVVGHPHVYFHDGAFFRRAGSRWDRCSDWKRRNWRPVDIALVPVPLARHYAGPPPGKDKGRHRGRR